MRGGTLCGSDAAAAERQISIHPPHAGWDNDLLLFFARSVVFQSTHPMRGGTLFRWLEAGAGGHFNPPTPCGVGLYYPQSVWYWSVISIHPPHAGWDFRLSLFRAREGPFQSTHPMRGGTCVDQRAPAPLGFQSTHPMRGGTRYGGYSPICQQFQSTHPMRGGTRTHVARSQVTTISIHPPHAGWDQSRTVPYNHIRNFNPPTPCGVGRCRLETTVKSSAFQSTHPMRGGTRL